MKAVEFEGVVTPDGKIALPTDIAGQFQPGESLHVALQRSAVPDEDDVWRTQGRQQFEAAYSPEDVVYEQLMDETTTR